MGKARTFPLDEPAIVRSAEPGVRAAEPAPSWPVLARIAEIADRGERLAAKVQRPSHPSYRLDPPHEFTPSPLQASSPMRARAPRSIASDPLRDDALLASAPLAIRLAVGAWRLVHPHHELIRLAAMLALMVGGGMSMMLMIGEPAPPADAPPQESRTANAESSAIAEPDLPTVELRHPIDAAVTPEADTTSRAPTAQGPMPSARAAMVIPPARVLHSPYPTTPFPAPRFPQIAGDALPRNQTSDPAVARLHDQIPMTQSR